MADRGGGTRGDSRPRRLGTSAGETSLPASSQSIRAVNAQNEDKRILLLRVAQLEREVELARELAAAVTDADLSSLDLEMERAHVDELERVVEVRERLLYSRLPEQT